MEYDFLIDSYDIERLKTLNVWSMFTDDNFFLRHKALNEKTRNPLEHMVHQCIGEDKWFCGMLGIDVEAPPLPKLEIRLEFIKRYAEDSGKRLAAFKEKDKAWWEEKTSFFDIQRSKSWILLRRIAHTAHHRGELVTLLRVFGSRLHSVYGPTFDTGGLPGNGAETIYAYKNIDSLIDGEAKGGLKSKLPGCGDKASTER